MTKENLSKSVGHVWDIFYPKCIEKEGKHFFYPYQEYCNKSEQEKMLAGF